MADPLRLAFFGTPDYALPSLERLHQSPHHLLAIWTKQANASGRGMKQQKSAVAMWAQEKQIPLYECANLKDPETLETFRALRLDAAVLVSFGILLPKDFLQTPRLGVLNLHPSLLPRWRGAAPIERAIWAGETKTGITLMVLGEGLDDGPILSQKEIEIGTKNAGDLRKETSAQGAQLVLDGLEQYAAGNLVPQPQDETLATKAEKLNKQEQKIDWRLSAVEIERQVRALSPKPGAWFTHQGERIHLLEARVRDGSSGKAVAGEVIGAGLVACGQGALQLIQLQRQGKRPLPLADFLRGFPLAKSELLS